MRFVHPVDRPTAEAACQRAGLEGEDLRTAVDAYCAGRTDGPDGGRVTSSVEAHAPDPIRMVADVKIGRDEHGLISCLVNGEEMNGQILADSLTVSFPHTEAEYGKALVSFALFADVEIDLPEAEVEVR